MFSIVCVWNDKKILSECLLNGLKDQTIEYELILIDNSNKKFISAAEALNKGGKLAQGNFIIFVHQDIDLRNKKWLELSENILRELPNLGVAGVAGKKDNSGVFTNILHGMPERYAGKYRFNGSIKVQTIDECMIIIPKMVFRKLNFDEDVCDDWHLYGVEYCLTIKKLGYDVYILPLTLWHRSSGFSFSKTYYKTLKKVINKHKKNYYYIYTTMGDWNTKIPVFIQRLQTYKKKC